jgi:stage V sporulation protein G
MNSNTTFEVRAFPIDEPKGNTLGFASISIGGVAAIRGIRIIQGENRVFVSMPSKKDSGGGFVEIAFPNNDDLRNEISEAVLAEWEKQSAIPYDERMYEDTEKETRFIKDYDNVSFEVETTLVTEPKGRTLAYVDFVLDNTVTITGARVVTGDRGFFLSMPQSKNKKGEYIDVAFPLNGDVRRAIKNTAIKDYMELSAADNVEESDDIDE